MNKFKFVATDGFFLTFFGAWCSLRLPLWEKSHLNMILIIVGIFFFESIVAQIRFLAFPSKEKDDFMKNSFNKAFSILGIIGVFLLIFIVIHFTVYNKTYLESCDKAVLTSLSILWLLEPLFCLIDEYILLVPVKKNNNNVQV